MAYRAGTTASRGRLVVRLSIVAVTLAILAGCTLINQGPTAVFTIRPSMDGVAPFEVTFSAVLSKDPDGQIVVYDWAFGDGVVGGGDEVVHTYTEAGIYTVILEVTDTRGATDSTTDTITVEAGPIASFIASPLSGRSPLPVYFNAGASSYGSKSLSYSWDLGDGATAKGVTATHMYKPQSMTTYTVTLTVRGPDGKEATATEQIVVSPPITNLCSF